MKLMKFIENDILMTTTITIDNETRNELLKIAAELQTRLKRKTNYNDAIQHLLQINPARRINIDKFKAACEQVPNIDPMKMIEMLHHERKRDDK